MSEGPRYTLTLLGGCALRDHAGPVGGRVAQPRRLAAIALIATAGSKGITRARLIGILWPDTDDERARRLLSDTLYVLRSSLGDDALLTTGDALALNTARIACDVMEFRSALAAGDRRTAVECYGGSFLAGFHVSRSPEFERWVDSERARLEGEYVVSLKSLADDAGRSGDAAGEIHWLPRLADTIPWDGAIALRVAEVLHTAGDSAGALRHIDAHAALLRSDLELEPDAKLLALAAHIRAAAPVAGTARRVRFATSRASGAAGAAVRQPGRVRRRFRRGVVFAVLAAVAFAVSGLDEPVAEPAAERGGTANAEARDLYLRAINTRPNTLAQLEEAVALLRRAMHLDPAFHDAQVQLAEFLLVLIDFGQFAYLDEANAAVARAVRMDSLSFRTHLLLETVHWRRGEYEASLREARVAYALAPDDPLAINRLALRLSGRGLTAEALPLFERALQLYPTGTSLHISVAFSLIALGRVEEGLERLRLALPLHPVGVSQRILSVKWAFAQDSSEVRDALDEAVERVGASTLADAMVWRAADYVLLILEHRPAFFDSVRFTEGADSAHVYLTRALVRRARGDPAGMRQALDSGIAMMNARIRSDEAGEEFSQQLLLQRALLYSNRSLMHALRGDAAQALGDAQRAIDRVPPTTPHPTAGFMQWNLARVQTIRGRRADAIRTLERVLRNSPEYTRQRLRLDPQFASLRPDTAFQRITALPE